MLKYFRNLVMIMKKIELLAPAGNMKCLHAAVEAGCDAVYLSGNCFGARAFAKNFSDCELVEAINYCHLYGVRVYVTVNTLLYEAGTSAMKAAGAQHFFLFFILVARSSVAK